MPVVGTQQSPIAIHFEQSLPAQFPADYFAIHYRDKRLPGEFRGHDFVFAVTAPLVFRGHSAANDDGLAGPKVVIGVLFRERPDAKTPRSLVRNAIGSETDASFISDAPRGLAISSRLGPHSTDPLNFWGLLRLG